MKSNLILLATLATAFMLSLGYANYCAKNKSVKVFFWLSGWILFFFHQRAISAVIDKYPSWSPETYCLFLFAEAVFFVFLFKKFSK